MAPRRLMLFGEGQGDHQALPPLITAVLTRLKGEDVFYVDPEPFVVGDLSGLCGSGKDKWLRFVGAAHRTRKNLGAILIVLDGDSDRFERQEFCSATVARTLAQRTVDAGAGKLFSLGVVFAMREFESWFIGGIPSMASKFQGESPERAPRDAKGWIQENAQKGYKPTKDQKDLVSQIDHDLASSNLRSFRRLNHALEELVQAARSGQHVVTPE